MPSGWHTSQTLRKIESRLKLTLHFNPTPSIRHNTNYVRCVLRVNESTLQGIRLRHTFQRSNHRLVREEGWQKRYNYNTVNVWNLNKFGFLTADFSLVWCQKNAKIRTKLYRFIFFSKMTWLFAKIQTGPSLDFRAVSLLDVRFSVIHFMFTTTQCTMIPRYNAAEEQGCAIVSLQ